VLGLGVPRAWAVLGTISDVHRGQAIFGANLASQGPLGRPLEHRNSIIAKKRNLTMHQWG
jgi:hypothetical protein